jgi:hypothetical protein
VGKSLIRVSSGNVSCAPRSGKMAAVKSVRQFANSVRFFCGLNVLSRRYASTDGSFHPRRSLLYIPGNDERKIKKASSLNADIVVLDCEDGVALNRKVCHQRIEIIQKSDDLVWPMILV